MMNFFGKKYLTKEDLRSLSATIGEAESTTSGEIRVVLKRNRQWNERKISVYDLTLREFYKLGMDKTRHRTGILILILFAEHRFQIIADEGINKKVDNGTWDLIASEMSSEFKQGHYRQGIEQAARKVGAIMAEHFPPDRNDSNELSNDVIES